MSSFEFIKVKKEGAELGPESSIPALDNIPYKPWEIRVGYDETKGLFLNFGHAYTSYPHRHYDNYKRELTTREYDAVILENKYLRAEFIPSFGGKLWSLYDKIAKRDLMFDNPVVRYCNFATRNAWTSGGLEFNIGEMGHHAYTVSQLFTAKTQLEDGTPVLRMYEYNRIRGAVYQMDFFLPEESKFLYCRMRIVNPTSFVIPMYWWSNAAIPKWEKGRIIVPASEAFMHDYSTGMAVVPIPCHHGKDMSYFENNPCSDSFYNENESRRKFMCYSDATGYTYAHLSTDRLKSRKLFLWGNGEGGNRWQEFLSGNGCDGGYIELQAGLANTQSEHLPMPGHTAWEWVEAYGAVQLDAKLAQNEDYQKAIAEAYRVIDEELPQEELDELLANTKQMALTPAKEMLLYGSGWGALENKRRKKEGISLLPEHLNFGDTTAIQADWISLLEQETIGTHDPLAIPNSWMRHEDWIEILEKATKQADHDNWYAYLQLGCAYYGNRRFVEAEIALTKSVELQENCWAFYALACLQKVYGNLEKAAELALKACLLNREDISLAIGVLKILHIAEKHQDIVNLYPTLSSEAVALDRVRMYYIYGLLHIGEVEKAISEFEKGDGLSIHDIREGELTVTRLWYDIEEAKAKLSGVPFDRKTAVPPRQYDFRMNENQF